MSGFARSSFSFVRISSYHNFTSNQILEKDGNKQTYTLSQRIKNQYKLTVTEAETPIGVSKMIPNFVYFRNHQQRLKIV